MQHLKKFNEDKFEGLEKDEQEFKDNSGIYFAKAWARHYITNATGKLSEKVDLTHKIILHAKQSGIPEVVELAKKVGIEYGEIKLKYIQLRMKDNNNEILRGFICRELFKATNNLIDKLRTIKNKK